MVGTLITINDVKRIARKLAELELNHMLEDIAVTSSLVQKLLDEDLLRDSELVDIVHHALQITGFVVEDWVQDDGRVITRYHVTDKAIDLLDETPLDTRIFISYKRNQNPLLALFLHTRLMLAGATPFLDVRNIPTGQSWHQALKDNVKESDYFISLLAPETLKSEPVATEISWARQYGILTIPIRHAEFDFGTYNHDWAISEDDYNWLMSRNGTPNIIDDNDMDSIRSQTEFLLNSLGYSVL